MLTGGSFGQVGGLYYWDYDSFIGMGQSGSGTTSLRLVGRWRWYPATPSYPALFHAS